MRGNNVMQLQVGNQVYAGKAKTLYEASDPDYLILEFRDDATAFNAKKHDQLVGKGKINNIFNEFIMQQLAAAGVANHFVSRLNDTHAMVKKLEMLPLECVIRNYAAGGIVKRYGLTEGRLFDPPIFEFFFKDDALGDPLINESHIRTFGWATDVEIVELQALTLQVNQVLQPLFEQAGFRLVDYKLEFGRFQGRLMLGDEFTPDGCRIWDLKTEEKFDKDRFRYDLGGVLDHYLLAAERLGITI